MLFDRWLSIENIKKTQYSVENLKTTVSYRFRVFAVNEVGVSESSEVTEYIKLQKAPKSQPPTVEKPLRDVIREPNEDTELTCIFGGIPEPKVTWYKDNKKLKTAKATYVNRVATLAITTTETSEGVYKCVAINEHGEAETSCTVEIQQKPVIVISEEEINQKHKVDDEWSVTATVTGIPKPVISWYRNGNKLESTDDLKIIREENTSKIMINQLKRSHSNKYSIEAYNKAGSCLVELTLKVYGKCIFLIYSKHFTFI